MESNRKPLNKLEGEFVDDRMLRAKRRNASVVPIATLFVAFVLLASSFGVVAAPLPAGANWTAPEGVLHQNFSPQTAVTKSNVKQLSAQWIFPLPAAPPPYSLDASGGIHTPLIATGIVYFVTNFHRPYAASASDGKG